jgi:hypothetical protein
VNLQQLPALFAQHRTAVLGGGAAAVAGLALWQRRKAKTGATSSTTGAKVQPAGTIPAAAVVPAGATGTAGYDSSAFDVYDALSQQMEQLRQTVGMSTSVAPAPTASALFAPTGSGNYVLLPNGVTGEVESDGTVFGLTSEQWAPLAAQGATLTKLGSNVPFFSTEQNLKTVAGKA